MPGTKVVSFPLLRNGGAIHPTGLSPHAPGGYAEQVLVEEALTLPVPNGLATDVATLTEPMAVGLHAVRRSEIGKRQVAIVIGCGPVGLAVIGMLKAIGVRTVVASDYSAGRRALARAIGADVVLDPAETDPFATDAKHGHLTHAPDVFELAVGTVEKLHRLPFVPWWRVWQAAEAVGAATPKHPVVFECVGVPGMIDQIITKAPLFSRVVVVGVCMQPDRLRPAMAINKEIDLRFVLGYTPREFRDALHLLADGKVGPSRSSPGRWGCPASIRPSPPSAIRNCTRRSSSTRRALQHRSPLPDRTYHRRVLATSRPPVPAAALIGRTAEVDTVRSVLRAPGTRLVTLTGPPGVGKTRLALAVAEPFDSVAWVDLAPVRDAGLVVVEVARALGLDPSADLAAAIDHDVLVVVDNCEHLLDAMPALGELLAATPHVQILATSRERLRLSAEHEFAVPALPMPTAAEVADWSRLRTNPAVAMLLARTPARVDLNRDTAQALAEVCIRLDGLPLAIELAAARLRVFTPAELAFRLERRMTVLTGGARDAPVRHRDLRTAIEWSHDLLSDRDRAVFRRLSVFPGDWTLSGAEAVCADPAVVDAVESLLDKSLIARWRPATEPSRCS